MSETLCTLRTKGGGGGATQVETVLWQNSAPTSSFAAQDVTLSDDINSYDYLKFTYRVTTSVADSMNYIISVPDFKKSVQSASINNCVLGLSTDDSSAHTRRVYYKTDTTVNFNSAYQLNAVASNNATVIPTAIIGIKNMGGKVFNPLTYVYESVTITSGYTETIPSGKTKDEVVAICINFALSGTPYTAVLENVSGTLVKVAGTLNVSMTFPTDTTIGITVDNYNKAYAIDWIFK